MFNNLFTGAKKKTEPSKEKGMFGDLFADKKKKSEVETFSLPEYLGGGSFNVGKDPSELIKSKRGYAGLPTKKGYERDHIIPVSLGGTSERNNLDYKKSGGFFDNLFVDKVTELSPEKRQAGILDEELDAIDQYMNGEISLGEARMKKITAHQKATGIIPKEEPDAWDFMGEGIIDAFKWAGEKAMEGVEYIGEKAKESIDYLKEKAQMPERIPMSDLPKEAQESIRKSRMIFNVGEGLSDEEEKTAQATVRKKSIDIEPQSPGGKFIAAFEDIIEIKEEDLIKDENGNLLPMTKYGEMVFPGEGGELRGVDLFEGVGSLKRVSSKVGKEITEQVVEKIIRKSTKKGRPTKTIIRKVTGQVKDEELQRLNKQLDELQRTAKKASRETKNKTEQKIKDLKEKKDFLKRLKTDIEEGVRKGVNKESRELRKKIGFQRKQKGFSGNFVAELKKRHGIRELKNASENQLRTFYDDLKQYKPGDKFLTDKQKQGLKPFIGENAEKTIREIQEEYGMGDVLKRDEGIFSTFPDIFKKARATIQRVAPIKRFREKSKFLDDVIGEVSDEAQYSRIRKSTLSNAFDKKMKNAKRSVSGLRRTKKVWNNIYNSLEGKNTTLTNKEKELKDFMQQYFEEAGNYLVEHGDIPGKRKNYVPHMSKELTEYIKDDGLFDGLRKWKEATKAQKESDIPGEIWDAIDFITGTNKFFAHTQKRTGAIEPTKNLDKIFKQYMSLLETKKYLDKVLPSLHATESVLLKGDAQKFLKDYAQTIKGRPIDFKIRQSFPLVGSAIDRAVDVGYLFKLGFRTISAFKNLIGGEVNSAIYNPLHWYVKGKKRFFFNPKKTHQIMSNYGFLDGDFVAFAESGLTGKVSSGVNKAAFVQQKLVEYEIRASEVMGLLTKQEYKTGKIGRKRIREIMDVLEETQGVYTPERTPIAAKTMAGRAALQFSRWIITDTSMIKKISKNAAKDLIAGKIASRDVRRLTKAVMAFSVGGYMANEYSKTGNQKAKQFAETLQEPIRVTLQTLTGIIPIKTVTQNPTLQFFEEAYNTLEMVGYKMGIIDYPSQFELKKGLSETYIAGQRQLQEMNLTQAQNSYGIYQQIKKMPQDKALKTLQGIKKENPQKHSNIKKYFLWDSLGLSDTEREFSRMGVKDGERAQAVYEYMDGKENAGDIYKRLVKARIITDDVKKQLLKLLK